MRLTESLTVVIAWASAVAAAPTIGMDPSLTTGSGPAPMTGKGLERMAGSGLEPMSGNGLSPMMGNGLEPMAGSGLEPMSGNGLAPMMGNGLEPMAGNGLQPMAGNGLQPMAGNGFGQSTDALQQTTDQLLFYVPLEHFGQHRAARSPPQLRWDSDGCTNAAQNPYGFQFQGACVRHDFGYRNYMAQGRFTVSNKDRIDTAFRQDLLAQCAKVGYAQKAQCEYLAGVYAGAVRLAPNGAAVGRRDDDLALPRDDVDSVAAEPGLEPDSPRDPVASVHAV